MITHEFVWFSDSCVKKAANTAPTYGAKFSMALRWAAWALHQPIQTSSRIKIRFSAVFVSHRTENLVEFSTVFVAFGSANALFLVHTCCLSHGNYFTETQEISSLKYSNNKAWNEHKIYDPIRYDLQPQISARAGQHCDKIYILRKPRAMPPFPVISS